MTLLSQTVASVIRTYSRIVTPNPSPGQTWRQNRHRAFEFFSRVLKGEMKVPLRLPAHTYLHGVIRNHRGYISRDVFTYVQIVVNAGVKVHPRTFSHITKALVYVDSDRPPLGGTLASYQAAYRLLGLAFLHKIPHDLRLYHDLAERFLDSGKYFDAVIMYSSLLMASKEFMKASVNNSEPATTRTSFTVSPEVAQQIIKDVQVLICHHLLAKLEKLGEFYESHRIGDSIEEGPRQLFARESKDAFQAINELARITRKREYDVPSYNLYRLLDPLSRIKDLKPDVADRIVSVNHALRRILSDRKSGLKTTRRVGILNAQGTSEFLKQLAAFFEKGSKFKGLSSSSRTGSSTDEAQAVQLEDYVAQLVSTAKSSELKGLKRGKRRKRPKVDETQDG